MKRPDPTNVIPLTSNEPDDWTLQTEQIYLGEVIFAGSRGEPLAPHELRPEHFAHRLHGEIFRLMSELATKGAVVDVLTLDSRLEEVDDYAEAGGRAYLAALVKQGSGLVASPAETGREIIRLANKRELVAVSQRLCHAAMDPEASAAEAIASVAGELDRLRVDRIGSRTSRYADLVADEVAAWDRPSSAIGTGIEELDDVLEGGLFPGRVYGFAGRAKSGKTITCGTIARHVARAGIPCVYFALEMGAAAIAQRIAAAEIGCNALHITRRAANVRDRLEAHATQADLPLWFEDQPGIHFRDLRALAEFHQHEHGVRVLILDYWQLVRGRHPRQSEADHLEAVADWIAQFAKRTGVAVVAAAQLNRDNMLLRSDGFARACDVLFQQASTGDARGVSGVHLAMTESRYTVMNDIGTPEWPALEINPTGPMLTRVRGIAGR